MVHKSEELLGLRIWGCLQEIDGAVKDLAHAVFMEKK